MHNFEKYMISVKDGKAFLVQLIVLDLKAGFIQYKPTTYQPSQKLLVEAVEQRRGYMPNTGLYRLSKKLQKHLSDVKKDY